MTTDKKPIAYNYTLARRTDSHILESTIINGTRSGDSHPKPLMRNISYTTYSDSDPIWGYDPANPEEA